MAEHESANFPEHCKHVTRRQALASTAALGALALPAGAAVALPASGAGELTGVYKALADGADKHADAMRRFAGVSTGTDPHLAWWADYKALDREIDTAWAEMDTLEGVREDDVEADRRYSELGYRIDELSGPRFDLLQQIAQTSPGTPEGFAIVAAALLNWRKDDGGDDYYGPAEWAGTTLARHVLDQMPADVLARAGVEV